MVAGLLGRLSCKIPFLYPGYPASFRNVIVSAPRGPRAIAHDTLLARLAALATARPRPAHVPLPRCCFVY